VRVTQTLISLIKEHLLAQGAAFMRYDVESVKRGKIEAQFPFFIDFYWSNLTESDPISLNLEHFAFNFHAKHADAKTNEIWAKQAVVYS